jgi:hypothetical protein
MEHLAFLNFLIRPGRQQGYRGRGVIGKSQLRAKSRSHADGILDFRFWVGLASQPSLAPSFPKERECRRFLIQNPK